MIGMNKIKDDYRRIALPILLAPLFSMVSLSPTFAQFGGGGLGQGPGGGPTSKIPTYRPPVIRHETNNAPVVSIRVIGNRHVKEDDIRRRLQTRVGRNFDTETVQADVRQLSTMGSFRNVRTYKKNVRGGIEVTFEVFELPTISYVRFVGNDKIKDKKLLKQSELKVGTALHRYRVEEAKRRLTELYEEKGFRDVEVEIKEGVGESDKGVVFAIHEGKMQRIWKTKFIGNDFVSDARLKTQVKSKPGILYVFKGKVDEDQIDADVDRLTAYYRSFGFFDAKISRTIETGDSGKWISITFVINEGKRYQIRNVSVAGNVAFTKESLEQQINLKSGDLFNAKLMNADLSALNDAYGSQGYIHVDIKAEPQFLEEPGQLDLVYDIAEGDQYRVGRINVTIDGDNPHTRKNVIMNRISVSPGDIIDVREIRASERRLRSSQLFLVDPARGVVPSIAIKPPELNDGTRMATNPSSSPSRGSGTRR